MVWVHQRSGGCYGALNGSLLSQLQRLFKIKLQNGDAVFVEYWLTLALTTVPENSGTWIPSQISYKGEQYQQQLLYKFSASHKSSAACV
jgi:hypothetical protein